MKLVIFQKSSLRLTENKQLTQDDGNRELRSQNSETKRSRDWARHLPGMIFISLLVRNKCQRDNGQAIRSVQSLSRVRLCNPMDCSTPGLPVHHQLLEFIQIHVHWVSDAIYRWHLYMAKIYIEINPDRQPAGTSPESQAALHYNQSKKSECCL